MNNSITQKTRKNGLYLKSKNDLRMIYLALQIKLIFAYGIIGWGSSYDNVLLRLKTNENTLIIMITLKKILKNTIR